jgi:hypothetical protein
MKVKTLLKEIEGTYSLDDNGNVTYIRVIDLDGMTKQDIYNRAKAFYIYNYNDALSVIQEEDKEEGRIIGKGTYDNVHYAFAVVANIEYDLIHILRIDIKDNKARVILSLTEYSQTTHMSGTSTTTQVPIATTYPFDPKGNAKTQEGKAFLKSHDIAQVLMSSLEDALRTGNTSSDLVSDDW